MNTEDEDRKVKIKVNRQGYYFMSSAWASGAYPVMPFDAPEGR